MGLPHEVVEIGSDARAGYRSAFARLRQQDGIAVLITGDIDLVEGMPNFVRECCQGLDVEVFMPLWQCNRSELMRKLVDLNFEVIFTLVKHLGSPPIGSVGESGLNAFRRLKSCTVRQAWTCAGRMANTTRWC